MTVSPGHVWPEGSCREGSLSLPLPGRPWCQVAGQRLGDGLQSSRRSQHCLGKGGAAGINSGVWASASASRATFVNIKRISFRTIVIQLKIKKGTFLNQQAGHPKPQACLAYKTYLPACNFYERTENSGNKTWAVQHHYAQGRVPINWHEAASCWGHEARHWGRSVSRMVTWAQREPVGG